MAITQDRDVHDMIAVVPLIGELLLIMPSLSRQQQAAYNIDPRLEHIGDTAAALSQWRVVTRYRQTGINSNRQCSELLADTLILWHALRAAPNIALNSIANSTSSILARLTVTR